MFPDPILSICKGEPDTVFLSTALSGADKHQKIWEDYKEIRRVSKVYFAKIAKIFFILRLQETFWLFLYIFF